MQNRRARSRPDGPDQPRPDGLTAAEDHQAVSAQGPQFRPADGGVRDGIPQRPPYCLLS